MISGSASLSGRAAALAKFPKGVNGWEQLAHLDTECRGDSNKIQGGHIPFTAFDTPKVGAVHPNLSGKSFLRVALAAAQLTYLGADCNQLGVLWHNSKLGVCSA